MNAISHMGFECSCCLVKLGKWGETVRFLTEKLRRKKPFVWVLSWLRCCCMDGICCSHAINRCSLVTCFEPAVVSIVALRVIGASLNRKMNLTFATTVQLTRDGTAYLQLSYRRTKLARLQMTIIGHSVHRRSWPSTAVIAEQHPARRLLIDPQTKVSWPLSFSLNLKCTKIPGDVQLCRSAQ